MALECNREIHRIKAVDSAITRWQRLAPLRTGKVAEVIEPIVTLDDGDVVEIQRPDIAEFKHDASLHTLAILRRGKTHNIVAEVGRKGCTKVVCRKAYCLQCFGVKCNEPLEGGNARNIHLIHPLDA